jgi:hypothetical protein
VVSEGVEVVEEAASTLPGSGKTNPLQAVRRRREVPAIEQAMVALTVDLSSAKREEDVEVVEVVAHEMQVAVASGLCRLDCIVRRSLTEYLL